jgi:hypothetical protein
MTRTFVGTANRDSATVRWMPVAAYLSSLERSPNTVRAYAISLRLWFEFPFAVVGSGHSAVQQVPLISEQLGCLSLTRPWRR